MAIYIYDYHDERGEFHAYVRDEAGNIAWEVHYPEYLEDDETGELLEGSTIFEDGYLKNADDLEGLYYYLLDFGAIEEDDEVVKLEDYEKMQEQKDDLLDFAIPKWAMSAIVNGDTSGLRDEDIQKIDSFESRLVELYGNANLMLGDVDGEDDLGFRYRNDIDGNLGADCTRMYLRPTKSYEDGGDMIQSEYGYGTSLLAKGGSLEDRIKKRLGENFELPIELAVYVPSTEKANQIVSKRDYASRIDEVRSYLANLFGGYSSEGIDGGYVSDEKGLIQEDVTKVTAFATKENFEQKLESLVTQIKKWCGQWGQESIGFEFEGDLFYISKDGKFMDGGAIPDGYHMMPDGTIMPDSAHMDKGGKVDDEDEEDKEQEHLEYVSEETNIPIDVLKEYASNKGIEIEDLDTDLGYQGSYVNEEAFAQYCADEGLINDLSYYLEMYDTDKRILVDEMSDNYVDDLTDEYILSQSSYEDEVEKLKEAEDNLSIQEGQLDDLKDERQDFIDSQEVESMTESDREDVDKALDEFDEKIKELEDTIEATNDDISNYDDYDFILEKAKDEVRAIYYDDLLDRLNKDAVGYFVDELGYEQKDLVDKNGFFIDLGLLARDLNNDYDFIEYEGEVYVFSSYYKYGGGIDLGSSFEKFKKSLNIIPNEVQSQIKDNEVLNMAMESVGDAWEDLTDAERELIVNSFREGYKKGNYAKGGEFEVDPTYTHFAVGKRDGKIVTGWEYKDLDKESIKYYTKVDLVDMDFKPSDFRILTTKYLKAQGFDPFDWDNWRKHNHYSHGGSVAEGNLEMLKNQAKEFKHHAEELGEVVDKNPRVDAWVVAKAERATSDLSDITHYLEGQEDGESFKDGGEIKDKDYTSIVKLVKGINPNVYTRVFKGNKVLVSLNEYSKNGLSYLRDSINEVLPNYSIRIGEGGVTEGMIIIEKDKMEDGGVTPKVFEKVKITIRDVDMGGDVIYKNDHWINKKALDEKSSSDIGKYILNKYGLDYGNTYKFSLKRTGETKEKMARGGELLSDVDMYVKIHGYYPMEVMAMRGDGMGTSIVRNEAHNFELSGVDSRKAEEMGYEFDYDQKGWVEVDEDDDDFAKGGEVEKKEYINKYIKDLGLDVEEMPARQYRYLSKQASRKYEKEKLEKMPYRKYRVSYRIPFGAIHSTIVDARTSNEARTIFRKTHGRDIQGNQDKILSVTLTKVKKEQGGMMASGGWMDDVEREMNELKKKYPKAKVTYFFAKNPNGKNYVIEVKEGNKVIYTSYGGNKMAKGGETKFISLTTRKGQSDVEKYTNQGWGIKFQNDKFAILERGGKKKN